MDTEDLSSRSERQKLQQIYITMQRTPHLHRSLDHISKELGFSKAKTIQLFKAQFGWTPIETQIRIRIEAARSLLSFSSLSVTQISENLGYSDVYTFSKQFKRVMGIAPSEMRA
jgi:transcriptional regulator GlxA family with amidase domain